MGFSNGWETAYQNNQHMSVWPWADLISYVMRYCRPQDKKLNVLELGCGAGANIPFFETLNVDYHAIEGSRTAVDSLHQKFPHLAKNIICDDFTKNIPFKKSFDLIFDRSALTHNI
ncbi:hypothetical protein BVY03_00080, partial [bacterium K02(2017)]